jgi:predicted GNAT family N-acyltransferase
MAAIEVRRVRAHESAFEDCREIRRRVFIEEQHVDAALEFDGLDEDADHFLAVAPVGIERRAAGTARLRRLERAGVSSPNDSERHAPGESTADRMGGDRVGKVERVAVLESLRGRGIGRELMRALEARAREQGIDRLVLHAQLSALPFYEELGYRAHGEVFDEAGIPHRAMDKAL